MQAAAGVGLVFMATTPYYGRGAISGIAMIVSAIVSYLAFRYGRFLDREATRQPWRRALAAAGLNVVLLGLTIVTFSAIFGVLPPSRLNLLYWVDPYGPDCEVSAAYVERMPILGGDVSAGDMCPLIGTIAD